MTTLICGRMNLETSLMGWLCDIFASSWSLPGSRFKRMFFRAVNFQEVTKTCGINFSWKSSRRRWDFHHCLTPLIILFYFESIGCSDHSTVNSFEPQNSLSMSSCRPCQKLSSNDSLSPGCWAEFSQITSCRPRMLWTCHCDPWAMTWGCESCLECRSFEFSVWTWDHSSGLNHCSFGWKFSWLRLGLRLTQSEIQIRAMY